MTMYLGIEIGGTKLQLGVGTGAQAQFVDLRRLPVVPENGAAGILQQIEATAPELIRRYGVQRIGFGFGGPVDTAAGRTTKSHQVAGWEAVPLAAWCREHLGCPAVLGNDCDVAALAEYRFGAGRGKSNLFYVTVGTGIGGGLVLGGALQGYGRPAIAEIGHLRPGLDAASPDETVESLASGWGIVAAARRFGHPAGSDLTGELVAAGARSGDAVCLRAFAQATQVLGWAIAQVITLTAPEVVVVGGGVSLCGEPLFFEPLRKQVGRYVFPPLSNSYSIVPAALGEPVVVFGALALAAQD